MVEFVKNGNICPHSKCRDRLNPSNAATNFENPSLAVRIAVEKGLIRKGNKVLEFGAGNLRNSLFILESKIGAHMFCYELESTINRFRVAYSKLQKLGGYLIKSGCDKSKYDVVVCTFVLETICPEVNRIATLRLLRSSLRKRGILIASFRGYPGVRGSKYKKCPAGEGLISSLNTFVKPYSVSEVRNLLNTCGFDFCYLLQKYKVDKPQNIHIIALSEVKYGKKLAREILY